MSELKIGDKIYWDVISNWEEIGQGTIRKITDNDYIVGTESPYGYRFGISKNEVYASENDAKIASCDRIIKEYNREIEWLKEKINERKERKKELLIMKIADI